MKLGRADRCPLHKRYNCCGRSDRKKATVKSKWVKIGNGVYRIDDPHHPRGYRIRRSKTAMRKLVLRKVEEQHELCCLCDLPFTDMADVTPEHLEPKGSGGAWHDDDESNIGASHLWCNLEKGSKRL